MWSVGCILYEMVVGQPIFPAKDENDLLEYFIVTLGQIPNFMIKQSKKYNQFFQQNLEGQDELIRSS
jgi:serine/threonine protein kinase